MCYTLATNVDQSQLVIQLKWLKNKNICPGSTKDIIPQSPVVNLCGLENDEFFPGSSIPDLSISGVVDLMMSTGGENDDYWEKTWWKGEKNVTAEALVDKDKIILLPLHIKVGLMK